MEKILWVLGRLAALLGLSVCAVAGVLRLMGHHQAIGFDVVTLFIVGIALMVAGCLAKLYQDDFS